MEIICVNDLFTVEQKEIWEKYSIQTPKEGKLYTIRDVIKSQQGTGYLLNEIVNPTIPTNGTHPLGVEANFEPNWGSFRFRNLDMSPVEREQEREVLEVNVIDNYKLKLAA